MVDCLRRNRSKRGIHFKQAILSLLKDNHFIPQTLFMNSTLQQKSSYLETLSHIEDHFCRIFQHLASSERLSHSHTSNIQTSLWPKKASIEATFEWLHPKSCFIFISVRRINYHVNTFGNSRETSRTKRLLCLVAGLKLCLLNTPAKWNIVSYYASAT